MRTKILGLSLFLAIFVLLTPADSFASEGVVELRSTNNYNYRCYATSLLMKNSQYNVLVGCRDLIYPPQEDLFTYVVWSTPAKGGDPEKLGELGVGKAIFRTGNPFNTLFVTTEPDTRTRVPNGATVMKGSVNPIAFLESETVPTPTPEDESVQETIEEKTQEEQTSTRQRLITGLKRAGLVSFLALIGVIGLVFVVTRPKS